MMRAERRRYLVKLRYLWSKLNELEDETVFEKLRYSLERKNVINVKVSFLHFNGIDDNHLDSEAYFSIDY